MSATDFFQFLTASVILTLSPGPDIIYVLTTSLRKGFKAAFLLSLGLCSGLIIHTSLVGLGVAQLISESDWAVLGLKLFGATYMLYLAWMVGKSPAEISIETNEKPVSKMSNYFARGFLMNVLNPKVSLFFLAFLPQFIHDEEDHVFQQALTLGFIFFIQAILIFTFVSYASGLLHRKVDQNRTVGVVLKWLQVLLFLMLAIVILLF